MWTRFFMTALALAALVGLGVGSDASAAPPPAEVGAEVLIIHATQGETPSIHGRLKSMEKTFRRFPMFNRFDLLAKHDTSLQLKKPHAFQMPNGKELRLIYRGLDKTGTFVKLRFEFADMHMNIRVTNGGLFFHAGSNHQGGRLLIAIRPSLTSGTP
jgi:hypothetical protein